MCRKGRSTFISLTAVAVYSQKQKQRLVSKLPDRCFRFDFAWLVTFNLIFLPAGWQQDHEHWEELQSSGQHIEHQHAFGQGTEQCEILGGTD